MTGFSILILLIGVLLAVFGGFVLKKRKEIIELANNEAEDILFEAREKTKPFEERIERLKTADEEIVARLKKARTIIENITDKSAEHAANIELITDDDLLTSKEYLHDKKEIQKKLRKLARNAVTNVAGYNSDVNIGKFVAISAKADMAGALLLTTTEMLSSKVTPNKGHQALERLYESIIASESLIKSVDSRAEIDREFKDLLVERLKIEINQKKAAQLAKEEQRALREQEREERRARQEAEKAEREALKEEEIKKKAIEDIEAKLSQQNEEDRKAFELELEKLRTELNEAHEKAERAKSRAQETKQGHVYIISNIGSFGDDILKIGMTRRLDPIDRVKELGDASVPFSFDIHALIESDNAPELENTLHKVFHPRRVNKVNMRKEYFRVTLDEIEKHLDEIGIAALINKIPSADEYYQTLKIEQI
ncbi:MAG: GIY-YIG nuclease family protein [Granulosicoccaceae bacterium]